MDAATPQGLTLWRRLVRLARHRWTEGRLRSAFPPDLLERLTRRVAASERRHTGQIRICIEAGLPLSYLWRDATARERAVTQFGKLRVWDTEHNNGVLIYLLLADRRIEILADRGLHARTAPDFWTTLASRLSDTLHQGDFESGLALAIEEIGLLLHQHYPDDGRTHNENELPNAVVLL